MNSLAINKLLGTYLLVAAISVTLFVSPWNSIDPVNLPKLTVLGVLASIAVALGLSNATFVKARRYRFPFLLIALFILQLTLVLIMGNDDFSFKFYGTPSRNTGFLAYLSLTFVLFASVVAASKQLLGKFVFVLVGTGGFLAIYGLAQSQGLDIWEYVNAYNSNVFGTFGNPNFQSAFMGMTASVSMTWVLLSSINVWYRLGLLMITVLAMANVALSSEQGNLNFIAGLSGAVLIYLFSKRKYFFAWLFMALAGVSTFFLMLGILNIGPLASIIYKSSLQARGFYWRAAINMMIDQPFFGVGPDGFGDWYRRSRTQSSAEFNAGIVADTAHSIPLDIAASGGIPLLALYLAIIGLAVVSIIKVVKRSSGFDVVFTSIVAAWVAYQAQSVISINQLGIGIWGWSLTGLLIGYELNTRDFIDKSVQKGPKKMLQSDNHLPAFSLLMAVVAGAIGLAISLPPYLAANQYYKVLQSGDGMLLQQGAYLKPYDKNRFLYTAQILADNKLDKQAIEVLADAAKIYPESFELWQRWSQIPSATPAQIAKAKSEMKRLDPFNPALQ
jgi:O-antigen ligase